MKSRQPITTFIRTHYVTWEEIDSGIEKLAAQLPRDITLLVAILRAGAPIAQALSRKTGLPIDYIMCSRNRPRTEFVEDADRAPRGQKILLVDDISGTGWTFRNCTEYCQKLGNEVLTCSLYYCEGAGMFKPDFGAPMDNKTYLRWPWEYQREPEMPNEQTSQ